MNNVNLIFQFTDRQFSLIRDLGDNAKFGPEKLDQIISSKYTLEDLRSLRSMRITWNNGDPFIVPSSQIEFLVYCGEKYDSEDDYPGVTWIVDEKGYRVCDIELTQIGWLVYSEIK